MIDRRGGKLYIDLKRANSILATKARRVLNRAHELNIRGANREGLERDGTLLKGQQIRNKEVVKVVPNPLTRKVVKRKVQAQKRA